jgi:hypothetical protein
MDQDAIFALGELYLQKRTLEQQAATLVEIAQHSDERATRLEQELADAHIEIDKLNKKLAKKGR